MAEGTENLSDLEDVIESISDDVSIAILEHLGETDGCAKEDMVDLDAIDKESEFIMTALREFGLIKVEGDIVEMTEKGRKVLEDLQRLEGALGD
jgi:hypothetical protein